MAESNIATPLRMDNSAQGRLAHFMQSIVSYALLMLDPHGGILSWNAGARRVEGYAAEEILGMNYCLFFTQEDCGQGVPNRALRKASVDGRYETDCWRIRKDGSKYWAQMTIDAVKDEAGQLLGFVQLVQDITPKRDAQMIAERARQDQMQATRAETIGQLAGGISHDFNDLMMVIGGQAERLRHWLSEPSALRSVEAIDRALDHGRVLTQQLLEFSRRRSSAPIIVDVVKRIANIREMLGAALRGNITLVCDIAEDIWPIVVDAGQLELALLNVALTARDAMPRGGVFTLSARNSTAASRDELDLGTGDFVEIVMSDTGDGAHEDPWSPSYETLLGLRDGAKDTSLGLGQARRFAQQAGGKLIVRPRGEFGSEAIMYLPRSRGPLPATETPVDSTPLSKKVLLVEDNEEVAEVMEAMLTGLGYEVSEAPDALEAMEILKNTQDFDVVLSDIVMAGGMSGVDLARTIKSTFPQLRCVLMSAYADAGLDIGTEFPLLRKPFKSSHLRDALDEAQHAAM
jgi:PAS domain S-box-containing protein